MKKVIWGLTAAVIVIFIVAAGCTDGFKKVKEF